MLRARGTQTYFHIWTKNTHLSHLVPTRNAKNTETAEFGEGQNTNK